MDKIEAQNILVEVAESLLGLQKLNKQGDTVSQIQRSLQQKYLESYTNQHFPASGSLSDVEVVNLVAEKSGKKSEKVPQIARQLPKFNRLYPGAGFECTLATALVRFALADAGYKTLSLLLRRHFVAMRELEDGSIKIYDAATRITVNGQTQGFVETFYPSEVLDKKEVLFYGVKKGYVFIVKTKRQIKNTEMLNKKEERFYRKQFFAYEPEILVDLAVVLENLSQLKNQKDKDSLKLYSDYPVLTKLDYQKIKRALNLFDAYDYLFE